MSAYSAIVGGWTVEVGLGSGVIAERRKNGEVWSTRLTLFPIGYRVGKVWTNGVAQLRPEDAGIPQAVVKKANGLADRLNKEVLA